MQRADDKIIVNNKKYIVAEEKEPVAEKCNKQQAAKPLYAWANQEQQAHRNEYVFMFHIIFFHIFQYLTYSLKNKLFYFFYYSLRMKHFIKEDKGSDNERDRMLGEFWLRKKEAEANKARVSEAFGGPPQVK